MAEALFTPRYVRGLAVVAAVVSVVAGLGVRAVATGFVAKAGGDALYTVLVYCLVRFAAPRLRPLRAAAVALAFSWAVELFQLSPVPAELSRHSALSRLVLGAVFAPTDLLWYTLGALLALSVDTALGTVVRQAKLRGTGRSQVDRPAA